MTLGEKKGLAIRTCNSITVLIREVIDNAPSSEITTNAGAFLPFISRRSEAVLELLEKNLVWDAEIIMRSVAEATLKYSFILADPLNIERRSHQFWSDWSEVNSIDQSERASIVFEFLGEQPDVKRDIVPIILDHQALEALRTKWTRSKIRQLKTEWSYGNIVRTLASDIDLIPLIALLHGYGMSSHLIHADETGIGVEAERRQRSLEERSKYDNLHTHRILSDVVSYTFFTGHITAKALGQTSAQMRAELEMFMRHNSGEI